MNTYVIVILFAKLRKQFSLFAAYFLFILLFFAGYKQTSKSEWL